MVSKLALRIQRALSMSIFFVRLKALKGGEQRVEIIVEMVGLNT